MALSVKNDEADRLVSATGCTVLSSTQTQTYTESFGYSGIHNTLCANEEGDKIVIEIKESRARQDLTHAQASQTQILNSGIF